MAIVKTTQCELMMLQDAVAAGAGPGGHGCLSVPEMILYTNQVNNTEHTTLSDLVQPTYAGYAPASFNYDNAYARAEGGIALSSPLCEFHMTDAGPPCVIVGYGVIATVSSTLQLMYSEQFPESVALNTSLDALMVSTQLALGGPDSGSCTVIN